MAKIPLPNGSKVGLATAFSVAAAIAAISNANPAVASSVGHGFADNDLLLLEIPGWPSVANYVAKASGVTADAFNIAGLDTTDTAEFPAGAGAGSVREVTGWTPLPKIPSFERTGGEPKTQAASYLDFDKDQEFFTGATPERLNLTMSYDPSGAAHAALKAAAKEEISVIRLVLKNGDTLYYVGQLFFNDSPTTSKDNEMVVTAALAIQGPVVRIAA